MNLQLKPHLASDLHLTSEQLSDLLAQFSSPNSENLQFEASDSAYAEAHIRTCAQCAAELASLREALSLFQEASVALADREFAHLRTLARPTFPVLPAHRAYSQTLVWMAASVVLMAGILPLEMRWQRNLAAPKAATIVASTHSAESDEALLEDIDRELSASVPAPMQALADPTGDAQTYVQTDTQTSSQGKD